MIEQVDLPTDPVAEALADIFSYLLNRRAARLATQKQTSPEAVFLADGATGEESKEKPKGDSLAFKILAHD